MADSMLPDESRFLSKRRLRKMSWVGMDEDTPYSYLRETMVADLMQGICDPDSVTTDMNPRNFRIEDSRMRRVEEAVGDWSFSAHEFSDDELLHGNMVMLRHALQMDELEKWRISDDDLTVFLLASRAAYNDFVLYHNFRHISDVLQAVFFFLVSLGTLPPYPRGSEPRSREPSAIADLLKPFDALTLLISAIGHDVGHPGVNNAFLVALNAPLAQLYNDRSVLESFHCAAYSQILRRHWHKVFSDISMRKLMIESILATDMGVHFKYMSDLGNLQEKLAHNNRTTDGWSVKVLEEYRDLTCGLLIKCADISNVARKFHVAATWANILTDEFSNQGRMEARLNMPTCLFGGPPVLDDRIKLGQSQLGFMNVFARPLFEAVTDILPAMQFSVDELAANKAQWDNEIAKEKERQLQLQLSKAGANHNKAPGLLHLRGLQQFSKYDGAWQTPSPKSSSVEHLVDPPPTSSPDRAVSDSQDDTTSGTSNAATARDQVRSSMAYFGDKNGVGSAAHGQESVDNNSRNASNTQLPGDIPPPKEDDRPKKLRKDKKDKRSNADRDVAAAATAAATATGHGHQTASMSFVHGQSLKVANAQAPDESAGSVSDFNGAAKRKGANASNGTGTGTGLNGSLLGDPHPTKSRSVGDILINAKPGSPSGSSLAADNAAAGTQGLGLEHSLSAPGPGGRDGKAENGGGAASGKAGKKFGLGRFWKSRRWRGTSGQLAGGKEQSPAPPVPKPNAELVIGGKERSVEKSDVVVDRTGDP